MQIPLKSVFMNRKASGKASAKMSSCKTKTICFTNNKGGSGKTTSCANLGYELAKAGKKVPLDNLKGDIHRRILDLLLKADVTVTANKKN